jgi:hypothetical protein
MYRVDDPERMTPEERATEVASILAAGILRRHEHDAPDLSERLKLRNSRLLNRRREPTHGFLRLGRCLPDLLPISSPPATVFQRSHVHKKQRPARNNVLP